MKKLLILGILIVIFVSGCTAQTEDKSDNITEEQEIQTPKNMTEELCKSAGGSWRECASACEGEFEICAHVCVPQCECGGIREYDCPEGYYCTTPVFVRYGGMGTCEKNLEFKPVENPDTSKAWFDFHTEECDMDSERPEEGITKKEWLNNNTLRLSGHAYVNCVLSVKNPGFGINGTKIILKYGQTSHDPDEPLVACVCPHAVVYTVHDLPMYDYSVELKFWPGSD